MGFDFGLAIRAFGIRVDNPSIQAPVLTAQRVTAVLKTGSLLRGRLGISRLEIVELEVEAIDANPAKFSEMASAPIVSPEQFDRFFSWDGGPLAADLVTRAW